MRVSPRVLFLQLHRWTGLSIGLFLVMMAITGAGMLFQKQLDPVINGDLLKVASCTKRLPLDTLITNASASNPGAGRLTQLRIFGEPDASTRIRFSDDRWYYVNPCTGEVLGNKHGYGGLFGTMAQLHGFRFLENSSVFVGTLALAFALLIMGGLAVWLPVALRGFRRAIKFYPHLTGRAYSLNLHKTLAVYASLILLAIAFTGVLQSFQFSRDALYALTGSQAPAGPERPTTTPGTQTLPIEVIWQRAQSFVPQASKARLRYPAKPGGTFNIELVAHDAPHSMALSYLDLDAHTGQVLRFKPYAEHSIGHRIYLSALALHYGWLGGMFMQLLQLIGVLAVPVLAYTGIGSYLRGRRSTPALTSDRLSLKVVRKAVEAENICSFELAAPAGKALPPFSAGSHINVHVPGGLVRQYSLCNRPGETHRYLIAVMRTEPSRGGSRAMHDELNEGDLIEVSAPKNHFPLAQSAKHSLLVAGGIGVTPILSMAEHLASIGAEFTMHYCTRSPARAAFADRIRRSGFAGRVFFHFSEGQPQQRLDLGALLDSPDPEMHLYVCGPEGFMNAVVDTARQKGWREERVHREYFSVEQKRSDNDVEFEVVIASTGKSILVPRDKPVVAALAECGIRIPTSCEQGVCGTCVTGVLGGVPQHRDVFLTDEEKKKNDRFTPCCSRANSRSLVLDL